MDSALAHESFVFFHLEIDSPLVKNILPIVFLAISVRFQHLCLSFTLALESFMVPVSTVASVDFRRF